MILRSSFLSLCVLSVLFAGCGKKTVQERKEVKRSAEDLLQGIDVAIAARKDRAAAAQLQELVLQYPDHEQAAANKLKLADLYLKTGELASAYKMFAHFCKMYPAHEQAEYARYKAILAKFYQTLKINPACDASKTEKTLRLCTAYLANHNFIAYRPEVKDIGTSCYARLIDKEVYIFDQYLRQAQYQSAQTRLTSLREKFLIKDADLEPRILYLECKLAAAQNKKDDAMQKTDELRNKFPDSSFTRMAENTVGRSMAGRLKNLMSRSHEA